MGAYELRNWWVAGGWGMYAIALFGMLSFAVSAVHAALARRETFFAALGLLLATAVVGIGFYQRAIHFLESALLTVAAEYQEEVRAVGREESGHLLQLVIPLVVISALPFAVGELRRFSGRRRAAVVASESGHV